jgi:hypothetical protein
MRAYVKRLFKFHFVEHPNKRGSGLSDRIESTPSLEERMDDVCAVLDAVGSERAAGFGPRKASSDGRECSAALERGDEGRRAEPIRTAFPGHWLPSYSP